MSLIIGRSLVRVQAGPRSRSPAKAGLFVVRTLPRDGADGRGVNASANITPAAGPDRQSANGQQRRPTRRLEPRPRRRPLGRSGERPTPARGDPRYVSDYVSGLALDVARAPTPLAMAEAESRSLT